MLKTTAWTIGEWLQAYRDGATPVELLIPLLANCSTDDPAWISLVSPEQLTDALVDLSGRFEACGRDFSLMPLYGVPFAVKDNIDVSGMPTTCACPAFSYDAVDDAKVVAILRDAGAIVLGKTNLDQFATGLVGTRSPYGAVPNTFKADYISGGSSSGSASVVARGIVPFALGTDTAGSGRVPAGLNNIVGLKPSVGLFSTRGLVPACRTLDCISLMTLVVEDADFLRRMLAGFDVEDPYSRAGEKVLGTFPARPVLGIPREPHFFGDASARRAWADALEGLKLSGAILKPIDFSPLHEAANLLYEGPWVAERYAAIEPIMLSAPDAINPVVRRIIERGISPSAVGAFRAGYRLAALKRQAELLMKDIDALVVPTAPVAYTQQQVEAEPELLNSRLGTYTNFVNLLDLCALAVPAGLRDDGLPFGITLIASAWKDAALASFGVIWQERTKMPLGASKRRRPVDAGTLLPDLPVDTSGAITVAVVGAHLSGMPLNGQLLERGAILLESTTTAPLYRLYALPDTTPPKPGLRRVVSDGAGIVVELWSMPLEHFGSFVALIPSPLGIGTLEVADGRSVKGFICEPWALEGARDITEFGGWRSYIASLQ